MSEPPGFEEHLKGVARRARRRRALEITPSAEGGGGEALPAPAPDWPVLAPEAYHGLAGEFVRLLEPHTEADPVAVLVQFLVCFGSVVGRAPHFRVESQRHALNLFLCLVGETSKGRKGTSARHVRELFREVDPDWSRERAQKGLSSGEGLIWAVRDPSSRREPELREGKPTRGYRSVETDAGVTDKRFCVLEGEFASTLRVLRRDGNTLSATLRSAWDGEDLQILTKNTSAVAREPHVSIVAHITREELLRCFSAVEVGNGFGNRFLWVAVRRSKLLPEGGGFDAVDRGPIVREVREAVDFARKTSEIRKDEETREIWAAVYPYLGRGKSGLLGAMISRAEAQTLRLAALYAVLDGCRRIGPAHLLAALAVWGYAEQSARHIFGDTLEDPVAERILEALEGKADGLSRTEIVNLFRRHDRVSIRRALATLETRGLATSHRIPTRGRPVERWTATSREPGREGP